MAKLPFLWEILEKELPANEGDETEEYPLQDREAQWRGDPDRK